MEEESKKNADKKLDSNENGADIEANIKFNKPKDCGDWKCNMPAKANCGAVYGLGLIGALVYFISTATGFWNGVLGVLKAFVWPAFMVYELFKLLGV